MTTTNTLTNGILYLTLTGDLIGSPDTDQLIDSVNEYLSEAITNCAGIGVLVSLLTKFRSRGGEMVLINPADHPKKMLALTKLNTIFTVAANAATALQQLTPAAS